MFVMEYRGAEHHNICRKRYVMEYRGAAHRYIYIKKGHNDHIMCPLEFSYYDSSILVRSSPGPTAPNLAGFA
jgi:hypothetical protein